MVASRKGRTLRLEIAAPWLADQTLAALALEQEREQWKSVGWDFELVAA
jgi:hypothetical protein